MTKQTTNLKTQPTLFSTTALPENGNGNQRAAFRRIRNFLAGRFVGATRDEALLAEVLKCLHCKTYFERNPDALDGFSLSDLAQTDSTRLALLCRQAFRCLKSEFPDFFSDADELLLDPAALAVVMREIAPLPLLDANRDPIGDAFETFIGSSVRGQDGQFFTPRNAAQFLIQAVQPLPSEIIIDPACGAGGFLTATLQHFFQRGAPPSELAHITERQLFGIDKDAYLSSLARTHLALIANARPNVACADSLAWSNGNQLDGFPPVGEYDVVLTNPPFGARIVAAEAKVLRDYSLARKWRARSDTGEFVQTTDINDGTPPQVLFMERCIALVKPGGRIGVVAPESLLSSKSYRHVVQFIRAACDVLLVVGMPESLFKTSGKGGTHTKTSLLVLRKRDDANARRPQLFMAEAKWCGHDSRGKPIPHDDLPTIANNYRAFQETGTIGSPSPLGFVLEQDDVRDHILAPRFYDPNLTGTLDSLRDTHRLVTMRELVSVGAVELRTGDEVSKLAYGTTGRDRFPSFAPLTCPTGKSKLTPSTA
jgi:type I restriction enzyme M protein